MKNKPVYLAILALLALMTLSNFYLLYQQRNLKKKCEAIAQNQIFNKGSKVVAYGQRWWDNIYREVDEKEVAKLIKEMHAWVSDCLKIFDLKLELTDDDMNNLSEIVAMILKNPAFSVSKVFAKNQAQNQLNQWVTILKQSIAYMKTHGTIEGFKIDGKEVNLSSLGLSSLAEKAKQETRRLLEEK